MKEIKLSNEIINDRYTQYVYEAFDIQNKEKTEVTIVDNISDELNNNEWNICLLYGGSGSGKSTLLNSLGNIQNVNFDMDKPLISNFDFLEPSEAAALLSAMGLSSVPTWLRPFKHLSNGEQYRAYLSYIVGKSKENEIICIDEFTSLVDRNVAKAMSFALQKYIRKHNKKIILASCHYDIIEWLNPDYSYDVNRGVSKRHDSLRQRRPNINLQIYRVSHHSWNFFKKHHYLTEDVNKSCKFFLFVMDGIPVGINAVIPQPSGHFSNGYRESRIVVLPDYQGLGLGTVISNTTAAIFKNNGYRYFTKTVHPSLGKYRNNSPLWKGTSKNGKEPKDLGYHTMNWELKLRVSYCHEYIGEPLDGFDNLMITPKR